MSTVSNLTPHPVDTTDWRLARRRAEQLRRAKAAAAKAASAAYMGSPDMDGQPYLMESGLRARHMADARAALLPLNLWHELAAARAALAAMRVDEDATCIPDYPPACADQDAMDMAQAREDWAGMESQARAARAECARRTDYLRHG
jgi:hypothetical protein